MDTSGPWQDRLAIRYRDRLVRAGDRWRFAERILVVDWESEQPLRAGDRSST